MSAEERCLHEMLVSGCDWCRPRTLAEMNETQRPDTISAPFEARFRGECAGCADPIEPGQTIMYGDHQTMHAGCETR